MPALLSLTGIGKSFGQHQVLERIDLDVAGGDVIALMGENGAGKSTLMNIISGSLQDYQGDISINGLSKTFATPKQAELAGVVMVHQELNLVPHLSIAENIFLGIEPQRYGLIDFKKMNHQADVLLKQLGLYTPSTHQLADLQLGQQQIVEIARALARQAKILILDEPTAALSEPESQQLFKLIQQLSEQGVGILYISHRLDELFEIANRAAVLRNGNLVCQGPMADFNHSQLISAMVGDDAAHFYQHQSHRKNKLAFQVSGLSTNTKHGKLKPLNLSLNQGEVLGLTGLLGSGCGECLKTIFGAVPAICDDWHLQHGSDLHQQLPRTPAQAIAQGIGMLSDDRKSEGLVLEQSLTFNIELAGLSQAASPWLKQTNTETQELLRQLKVKYQSASQAADSLSGGNQQKIALAKWLPLSPSLLLLNEPSRGVDIGAKAEIYTLLSQLSQAGLAMIIASTDLPEIMSLSDRILVLKDGQIQTELTKDQFSQKTILHWAQGQTKSGNATACPTAKTVSQESNS